jgi:ASCH domain
MATLSALLIKAPYVDWVLDGKKTWEIRSRSINIRGRIGLIKSKSKSKTVVGTCQIVEVIGPLTTPMLQKNARTKMNRDPRECGNCVGQYAWVLGDVRRFVQPVRYKHPQGAVTWVTLDQRKAAQVLAAKSVRVR